VEVEVWIIKIAYWIIVLIS